MHCSSMKDPYFRACQPLDQLLEFWQYLVSIVVFLYNKCKFLKMQAPPFLHYVNVPYSTAVLLEYSVETEAVICSVIWISISR